MKLEAGFAVVVVVLVAVAVAVHCSTLLIDHLPEICQLNNLQGVILW